MNITHLLYIQLCGGHWEFKAEYNVLASSNPQFEGEEKLRNNTNVEYTKCCGTDVLEVLWEHREMGFAWVNFWNRKLQGTTECF